MQILTAPPGGPCVRRVARSAVVAAWRPLRTGRLVAAVLAFAALGGCVLSGDGRVEAHRPGGTLSVDSSLRVARAALEAGQIDAAERLFSAIASRGGPGRAAAWVGMARVSLARDDPALVRERVALALEHAQEGEDAVRGAAYGLLAQQSVAQGAWDRAAEEARKGLGYAGDDPYLVNVLAVDAARSGAYEHALALYGALSASSLPPVVEANRLRVLIEAGRVEEAYRRLAARPAGSLPSGARETLSSRLDQLGAARRSQVALPAPRLGVAGDGSLCLLHRTLGDDDCAPAVGDAVPVPPEPGDGVLLLLVPLGGHAIVAPDPGRALKEVFLLDDEVSGLKQTGDGRFLLDGKAGGGSTELVMVYEEGGQDVYRVVVESGLSPLSVLREALARDPGLGDVQVRGMLDGALLTGTVRSAQAAGRAMRLAELVLSGGEEGEAARPVESEIKVAGAQQVRLDVQIAEVARTVTERLGVSWEFLVFGDGGRDIGGVRYGLLPDRDPGGALLIPEDVASGLGIIGFAGGSNWSFGALLDALSTAGLANVMARPTLIAASGEEASFFSGADQPHWAGISEDGRIVISYRQIGVRLAFRPTVLTPERISLQVNPEVSEISTASGLTVGGDTAPAFPTRRASTVVEVGDGQTLVIAGLYRQQVLSSERGITGLKDVPLLGPLFSNTGSSSDEVELIVSVTARLVEPRTRAAGVRALPARTSGGYYY